MRKSTLTALKNTLSKCRGLCSMVFHDPAMIAEAMVFPLFLPLSFRFAGVQKTQAWLRNWAEGNCLQPIGAEANAVTSSALRTQLIVKRTTGLGGSCLVRSLSLWVILRRRGVHASLRIGMRRSGEKVEGHAWLEIDGIPVNEKQAVIRTYTVFDGPISFDEMTRTW
jgi:transglutaminase superfamily protein